MEAKSYHAKYILEGFISRVDLEQGEDIANLLIQEKQRLVESETGDNLGTTSFHIFLVNIIIIRHFHCKANIFVIFYHMCSVP